MLKRTCALVLSFVMAFTVLVPNLTVLAADAAPVQPAAADEGVVVDDTVTDSTQKHYFTYTAATDPTGHRGWAADTKASIIGDNAAKTQHWVWDESPAEAGKHTYTFTFEGTGVQIYGVKNDNKNVFQLDENDPEVKTITGNGQSPVVLYEKKGLTAGKHVVKATLPTGEGTGLQVCYAKVFGAAGEPQPEPDPEAAKPHGTAATIRHDKQSGASNKFTYSQNGTWTVSGTHSWSNRGTKDEVWYMVNFVGNAIDVYSGKNNPMGIVAYYIDDVFKGEYSLFRNGNVDEEFIVQFAGLDEGEHTFKAVATGKRAQGSTDTLIDAAKVVVYHEPYTVTSAAATVERLDMKEGGTHALALTLVPDYTTLADVEFATSKASVATVTAAGVVEAAGVGDAEITVSAKADKKVLLTIPVHVTETTLAMGGSIVDVDTQYTQDRYEEVKGKHTAAAELTAWRNDKAISEIALVSKDCKLKNVTVTASDLTGANGAVIPASNVETSFITSTTAYAGRYPGYGSMTRPVPQGSRKESNDILYQAGNVPMDIAFNAVQPVFVKINVPKDAKAGDYTTTITVQAERLAQPLQFTYILHVQDTVLQDAADFKNSFDIELWQYPYSIAEYYGVKAFSPEHLAIMQPHMELYKEIGGHAITATILEDAWDGQTYSKNPVHYPSMIRWEMKDGQMTYNYADFDKWVEFNQGLGIGDKIVLYSVAPWHNSFTYWQNGQLVKKSFASIGGVGSAEYNRMWKHFLTDLAKHLDEKGWFDAAYIGIDERGLTSQALDVVASVTNKNGHHFKTAGAINNFEAHKALAMRMTDINIGDNCVVGNNAAAFDRFLAEREKLGLRTTLYTCTEHKPGNFSLSAPVESYWSVINAGEKTAGMLRWAYDAWVEDPLRDATHNAFEPGDCFLVYPDEKTAATPVTKSSLRLERMAQGVRDVNKLRQMVAEYPDMQADVDAVYDKMTVQAQVIGGGQLLNETELANVIRDADIFRTELDKLTAKYLDPKAHGGYEYTRVPRSEITDIHADSQTSPANGNDGPAAYAFDGNTATMWHSNYGSGKTPCPHEISWKIGTAKEIGRIQYVARASGSNGNWKKITVQGRNGNGAWVDLVKDLTLANGSKNITFAPQTVTELKVIVNESYGDQLNTFATAAEIVTYAADLVTTINAKRQALRDQYADVCEVNTANYTPASVARLDEAEAQARAVFGKDEVTDAEIEAAAKALTAAVNGLQVDAGKLAPGAPAGGTSANNPFPNQGDKDCITENVRIPAIITLDNGWLAAAADARWDHHGDHGNIDGMFSISKDNGKTWHYTFPMFFNDSTNLFHDYAATLMDPVLTQGEDGRLYMLIDAFPGGHALSAWAPLKPSGNSGFVDVNGTRRLAVYETANNKDVDVNSYLYYIGDFAAEKDPVVGKQLAPVLEKGGNGKTAAYYVDQWFNLYTADKNIMVCPQIGSDKFVQQNLFYYNADLHLRSATFLMLMTSDDNGATWSQPTLVDARDRGENTMFYGIGPGAGLSFVDAAGTNVIVLPTYVHPNEYSGFIYSTDRGETWACAPNVSFGSSESCIIQLNENTVRKFTRSGATQIQYADYTWHPETKTFTVGQEVQIAGTSKTANNQVSAVRYPKTMDGKPVVLFSTATGGNRGHGHIYTLSIEPDGSMQVLNNYTVSNDNYDYHYSSLTVDTNGDIALFYEDNFGGRGWGAGGTSHHTFLTIPAESLGLTGKLEENAYTFNIPLYSEMDGSLAPVPAQADLTALNESGAVRAEVRDGKVFYTGLKAGTQKLTYIKNGQNITVTLNVAKDASVKEQDVTLKVGETQKFDVTGEITYHSNAAVVGTAMETINKTTTMAQTGTDKNFTGTEQPLTDALFTFTHKTGSNYTIQNGDIYLALKDIPHATLPYSKTAQDVAVEMRGNSFTMHVDNGGWLWFWKNDANKLHFDRNSAHADNCNFDLFRVAQPGEATPEISGFVKLTGMNEILSGGKYLIAVKATNGQYYVMRASDSGDKYQHVLHVTGEKSVPTGRTLTLTGLTAGKAVVVAGDTAFHVTVKNPEPVQPAKLYGASLSLAGDVGVNFFYEFQDAFASDETARVEMVLPSGQKLTFPAADGVVDTTSVPGKTLYKFTAHVAVRQMAEDITVTVLQGDQQVIAPAAYAVRDYADAIMNDADGKYTAEQKAFVKAMLYHGAAMQMFKDHNTEHLATQGLNVEALDKAAAAITPDALKQYAPKVTGEAAGLALYGVNLNLMDETTLRFFFTTEEGHPASSYTFAVNGKPATAVANENFICVEVSGIAASRLDDMVKLTVNGDALTVDYAPLSYVRSVIGKGKADALDQVARSLYLYNAAANQLTK